MLSQKKPLPYINNSYILYLSNYIVTHFTHYSKEHLTTKESLLTMKLLSGSGTSNIHDVDINSLLDIVYNLCNSSTALPTESTIRSLLNNSLMFILGVVVEDMIDLKISVNKDVIVLTTTLNTYIYVNEDFSNNWGLLKTIPPKHTSSLTTSI